MGDGSSSAATFRQQLHLRHARKELRREFKKFLAMCQVMGTGRAGYTFGYVGNIGVSEVLDASEVLEVLGGSGFWGPS